MTKFGTGVSHRAEADEAGREAAAAALADGSVSSPHLAFAFCSGGLEAPTFFAAVRDRLGAEVPIIGGSAIGVLTPTTLSYRGTPSAVAVLESDAVRTRVASAGGLDRGEPTVGAAIARTLGRQPDDRLLLAFYDSIQRPPGPDAPPRMFSSTRLLEGIARELGPAFPVAGAGLLGGFDFGPTVQFCGDAAATRSAVGCMLSGEVTPYVAVMHGCVPLDGVYRRITAIEGDVLLELDGRPVAPLIDELFGSTDWRSQRPVGTLTLGVNRGDRFGPPVEGAYVNRLITGVTADGHGVGMFEPDLAVGTDVQFMLRDNALMFASAREHSEALLARIEADGRRALFALYIDCAGRAAATSYTDQEEATVVGQRLAAHGVPWLGFYSGVEVAPLLGENRGLDWTGVLLVLAEVA